jgi:hypothetical protein
MGTKIQIFDVATEEVLGEIDETQLRQLVDLLEEEHAEDRDYWIDGATIEMLADGGADPDLLVRLRDHLAGGEGFDVGWRRV